MSRPNDVYAKTFDAVITAMENGVAPWVRPWSATRSDAMPHNAATGRPYSGGNVVALWAAQLHHGYTSAGFVTFKQALEAQCVVRKGEKGHAVYFFSTFEKVSKDNPERKDKIFLAKGFTVFNVDQLDELEPGALTKLRNGSLEPLGTPVEREAGADTMVVATGAHITHGGDRAFYAPSADRIGIPCPEGFTSMPSYYGTLFHELGHWTGHKSRLDRLAPMKFGDPRYAFEELVAELCAAFLSARFGWETVSQSASYLNGWAKACREEPDMLARAASMAAKAADHITSYSGAMGEAPELVAA